MMDHQDQQQSALGEKKVPEGTCDISKEQSAPSQLVLFEPHAVPYYGRDAFVTSNSNEHVLRLAQSWLISEEQMLIVCGGAGAGKTHFAHVMATMGNVDQPCIGNTISEMEELIRIQKASGSTSELLSEANSSHLYFFDNVEACLDAPQSLLDLIENYRMLGGRLVLIGRGNPSSWAGGLKDLLTRLEAMPRIHMPDPDEDLMRLVISRHLRNRQFVMEPSVFDALAGYALPRLPRTFEAAHQFARAVDLVALQEKKKPGVAIARKVIEWMHG